MLWGVENILYARSTLSDVRDYDVIWFGSRSLPENPDIISSDLPKQRWKQFIISTKRLNTNIFRTSNQTYILWEIESPAYLLGFQPSQYQTSSLRYRWHQSQIMVDWYPTLGGKFRSKGQCLLRQIQPQFLLPFSLWFGGPLRSLLRFKVDQETFECV